MGVACSTYRGEEEDTLGFGRKKLKITLENPRRRWEDNTKIYRKEIKGRKEDCSGSGQGQEVGCCEHDNELSVYIKGKDFLE
jgi:hypothetical protein